MQGVILCICFALSFPRTEARIPAPSWLSVDILNSTTVVACWDPIGGGSILGYHVYLRDTYSYHFHQNFRTNKTSIVVKDLKDWLQYRLRVQGYSAGETGGSSYHYFYMSTIPGPSSLNVDVLNGTTMVARWNSIPQKDVRVVLLGYIVKVLNHNSWQPLRTLKTNKTSIVVKYLQPNMYYRLIVQVYTANEKGRPTSYSSFYIPRIPAPSGLNVDILNSTTAVARWDPIGGGSILGYHVYLRDTYSNHFHQSLRTNKTSILVKDLKDWLQYRLTVQGYTAGETGQSSYHYFYMYSTAIPRSYFLNLNIINVSAVATRWYAIPKEQVRGVLLGYIVRLLESTSSKTVQTLKTNETSIVVKDLQPRMRYRLTVQGYTANETGRSSYHTFNIPPILKISALHVDIKNTTTMEATWNPIPKENVSGALLGYVVELRYYKYYSWPLLQTIKTNKTSIVVKDLKDWLQYELRVQGYTASETGDTSYHYFYISTMSTISGVNVDIKNITAVKVRWYPLPSKHVLGYIVRVLNYYSWQLLQTLKTNETSIVVKGLKPRLQYNVFVQGFTSNETGKPTYSNFYIPPILRISGFKVTIVNKTTVVARWSPITRQNVLGSLLGYKVQLDKYDWASKYFKTNDTSIVIKDLQPGSDYRLYIRGYTAIDTGDSSSYYFVTPCGGILKNQLHGKIAVKGQSFRSKITCTWEIQGQRPNSMILIVMESLRIAASYNCRESHLEITDGQGQRIIRLCGSRRSMTFVSFDSAKVVFDHTRWWSNPYEISMSYIMITNGIDNVPVNRAWNISASSNSPTSVTVQKSKYPGQESVNYYNIAVCIAQNKHGNISASNTDEINPTVVVTNLLKNTEYKIVVLAFLKKSLDTKNLNDTNLNGTLWKSPAVFTRTMEDVPSKAPSDIKARSFGPTSILVNWKSLYDINGVIVGYNVHYQPTRGSGSNVVFIKANITKIHIKQLIQVTEYRVTVAALTKVGEGPKSRSIYVTTGCRQSLKESSGRFTSPNYPSNYPSNVNCTWTIANDRAFDRLFILFWTIDMEEGCSDFVKVIDKDSNVLCVACGRQTRLAVVTQKSTVVILKSDSGIEKSGFSATYFTTDTNNKAMTLTVNGTTSTEVSMHWERPLSSVQSYFTIFYKKYKENSKDNWNFVIARNAYVRINGLSPSTKYVAMVTDNSNMSVINQSDLVTFVTNSLPTANPTEAKPTESVKLMYEYGLNEGDQTLPNTWEYTHYRCKKLALNEDGFLFLTKRHHEIYICRNGVMRFESPYYLHWPVKFGSTTESCKPLMLAPYWLLSNRTYSTVFYHVYKKADNSAQTKKVLDRATSDVHKLHKGSLPISFKASWVTVVTWHELRIPHSTQNPETNKLRNTFQAVLITDGIFSFAMYNYPVDGIQWSAPTTKSKWKDFYSAPDLPVVGWTAGCRKTEKYNVHRSASVYIGDIDQTKGHSVYITKRGILSKNHGFENKWLFQLYKPWKISEADKKCKPWFKKEPDPRPFLEYLEPCPCTSRQAWFDERFTPEKQFRGYSWWSDPRPCAISTFPSIDGWEQKCCYTHVYPQWGAIVVGHPGGGFAHRYSKIYASGDHSKFDFKPYMYCCVHLKLCHLFYQKRPSDDCSRYEPPEWSWMWGDPHFVTLDGTNYTFNGLGEYIMLDARNGFFQLQSRTRLAKGDGTATVFCAAVMKEGNSSSVQLNLERNGNITLLVDGINMDYNSLTNETKRLNSSVVVARPKETEFRATYSSGISVTLTVSKGSLSIRVALPKSFRNQTKGLLGTWNGNKLDDLTTPIGNVVPVNASSRTIHFEFGQKWQINENNTLFTYHNRENVSTFSNKSFTPMFLDELKFTNKTLERQAREECGNDINCLFDAASTNDISVGLDTKVVGSQMVNDSITLKNSPPKFTNSTDVSEILLMVNTTKCLNVTAYDSDGDSIRFDVLGLPKGGVMSTNASTASVSWHVTIEKVELKFIATDSNSASAVLRPKYKLCACQNGGSCTIAEGSLQNQDSDRFSILPCQCSSGYTGKHCEVDIDACKVNLNPCYPGVKCKDFPAPANETGYECGPCPSGFTGKGDSCQDIDECFGSNGCSQTCSNTPGSYVCSCKKGYLLNLDGRTCQDINECDPASDCMQKCENTVGSYRCSCNKYFKVDPTDGKKCIPKLPCKNGNHQCQDICYESNGVATCACNMGYALQADNKTCIDVDECKTQKNRCNQLCQNRLGGYDCSCMNGFRLSDDNITCVDINECFEWTFNCSVSQRCENTIGSYKCKCDYGLYWIDNRCQELPTGEKVSTQLPTSTAPPPTPATPSKQDMYNSVNVTIRQLNIAEWDVQMELTFKKGVAREVTSFCAKENKCQPQQRRERRSNSYNVFTSDQVQLLPGFPVQIYHSIPGDYNAIVACYVKLPSDSNTINGDILAQIINGSLGRIGKDIGKLVLSVSMYQHRTEATTESPHTTSPTKAPNGSNMRYIIIGSSLAGFVLIAIVVIAIVVVRCCKTKDKKKQMVQNVKLVSMRRYDEPIIYSNPTSGPELK